MHYSNTYNNFILYLMTTSIPGFWSALSLDFQLNMIVIVYAVLLSNNIIYDDFLYNKNPLALFQ